MSDYIGAGTGRQRDIYMVNNNYLPGAGGSRSAIPPQPLHVRGASVPNMGPYSQSSVYQNSTAILGSHFANSPATDSLSSVSGVQGEQLSVGRVEGSSCSVSSPSQTRLFDAIQTCTCGNSFTFTTPTQSYVYSPTVTSTTPNRMQYSRVTPQTFAPTGCSAQWQHSVPPQRSWLQQSRVANHQARNVYTGKLVL